MSEKSLSERQALPTPKSEMRAVAIERFGGPEVLSVRNVPVPEPEPDKIVIQVGSAGIGAWDVGTTDLSGILKYSQRSNSSSQVFF